VQIARRHAANVAADWNVPVLEYSCITLSGALVRFMSAVICRVKGHTVVYTTIGTMAV